MRMLRAALALFALAAAAEAQTGRPPLEDLDAAFASRIPFVNGDAAEAYIDARDSIADLQALGWTISRVSAASCANSATDDFSAIQAAANAASGPTAIYLDDTAATPCVYNGPSAGLTLYDKSNVLLVGLGEANTIVRYDGAPAPTLIAGVSGFLQDTGVSYPWSGGFSAGDTLLSVSDAGGAIASGDRVIVTANDADGHPVSHTSVVVASSAASSSRSVSLLDPLPVSVTRSGATLRRSREKNTRDGWVETVGAMHLTLDQSRSARVRDADAHETTCAACPWASIPVMELRGVHRGIVEHVSMPHTFSVHLRFTGGGANGNSDHVVVRSSSFGELYLAYNRANNNSVMAVGSPNSNGHYLANNAIGPRAGRFMTYEGGGTGIVTAWNYQATQEDLSGGDTTCDDIDTTRGGGGRSIFFHGGRGNTSGAVVEGNDLHCHVQIDGNASDLGRANSFYRNRLTRLSHDAGWGGVLETGDTAAAPPFLNMLFNRSKVLYSGGGGGAFAAGAGPSLAMVYNVGESNCVLGRNGAQNGCSGTNANPGATYVGNAATTAALSAPQAGVYPPSLVLSRPPKWWCREACPWTDTSYGSAEANSGGALCKLPAQIRYEGRTCTPLSVGVPPASAVGF